MLKLLIRGPQIDWTGSGLSQRRKLQTWRLNRCNAHCSKIKWKPDLDLSISWRVSLYFHLQITGVLISRNTCLHVQAKTDSGNHLVFCSVGSSGVKWPEREADGSPISSAKVRNILNGNTVPPQLFVMVNVSVCGLLTLRFGLLSLGSVFDAHWILLTVGLGSFQGRSGNFG